MGTVKKIKKKKQQLLKSERNLALQKLKLRRSETRKKIELGDIVIKSNMDKFSKTVILGALLDLSEKIKKDKNLEKLFHIRGEALTLDST